MTIDISPTVVLQEPLTLEEKVDVRACELMCALSRYVPSLEGLDSGRDSGGARGRRGAGSAVRRAARCAMIPKSHAVPTRSKTPTCRNWRGTGGEIQSVFPKAGF